MPDAFPRSLRRLNRESAGRSWWMPVVFAALFGAWVLWFLLARVTVYAVSESARLEVEEAACPIEASVDGRVSATHIVLGADVQQGDALLELDTQSHRFELGELRAVRAGRMSELQPLKDEIRAQERQLEDLRRAGIQGLEELAAEMREEEAALRLADNVVTRSGKMRAEGLVSEIEFARAQFEVEKHRAGLERNHAATQRLESDRGAQISELEAKVAESRRLEARVQSEIAGAEAAAATLENEIEQRTLRAPVSGRLGGTANLRVGQFVAKGTHLAAIVPRGGVKIVAAFRPQDALGRIHSGQNARFRLQGFSWTQYGFVPASVTSLASEALAGSARVESSIARGFEFPVALQHGWPGTLEIEVERVSPATLVLRASGALLAGGSIRADASDSPAVGP